MPLYDCSLIIYTITSFLENKKVRIPCFLLVVCFVCSFHILACQWVEIGISKYKVDNDIYNSYITSWCPLLKI